jgi:hypothetical protein
MSIGVYGSRTLASVSLDDVDILYSFSPNRENIGDVQLQPLFDTITSADFLKMFGADGLYKMRLSATIFKDLGFYNILIKPKSFETTIVDCSYVVTTDANQTQLSKKGIVIPLIQFQAFNNLIGYQVEYFDNFNNKINNLHRIITSSDLVSISPNNNTINNGASAYVLDPNGSNIFLTVTPDEASIISRNVPVDIGRQGQKILLSNTYFDPVFIEVEMVEHTIETLAIALYGNSTRDIETGVLTYFNNDGTIYRQYNLYTRKKQFTHGNIDIREARSIINFNQDFTQISQGLVQ